MVGDEAVEELILGVVEYGGSGLIELTCGDGFSKGEGVLVGARREVFGATCVYSVVEW